MVLWVCDWTHWQGEPVPAERVKQEGYSLVKLKAGGAQREGWTFEDPTFFRSVLNCQSVSLPFGAYWYLMPGRPIAQVGLFVDMLYRAELLANYFLPVLDVEQPGVKFDDVRQFVRAWEDITGRSLVIYTSKFKWTIELPRSVGESNWLGFGALEDAHWVAESVRNDTATPYASQQYHAVKPEWWDIAYGGWHGAAFLQFTDRALVANRRVPASAFRGTHDELLQLMGMVEATGVA
jgi:hypothetical protein